MKFKKVEIQAFRAYNKVEDGTFDFTTGSNEIADFISIYAPNGSGKTSFYDAIEWGFTRNISRFIRRRDDNRNFAKTEERNFQMRNKFAEIHTDSVVRLYTTAKDQPFEEKVEGHRANRSGSRFNEKKTIKGREYFRYVLLSQEWIDAFLKEDDASIRYEKFIRSFGDASLNRKYSAIVELIKINNDRINELSQELQSLQSKNDLDFDIEILSKINSEIELLNKTGEHIPVVQRNWTEKHLQQLTDQISERIIDIKYSINKSKEEKSAMDSVVTGNNISGVNIELYFTYKEQIRRLDEEMEKLRCLPVACPFCKQEYTKTGVGQEMLHLEKEKETLRRKLVSFEYFIQSEFDFDLSNKEKSELETFIKEKSESCKKAILSMEKQMLSFEKTKKYKESILPFLKYDELKRAENEVLRNKSFLEKKVRPKLEYERQKISKYIDNQVESFFNGKLINLLYQKLDPHPVHEEIKFKCDFSTDKPQLNAFVVDEKEGLTPIIPTLFFSAPQLNTLSLSLFLAKALNVKDNKGNAIDCIFIDDPIQSMDSINILSMIDLLRSISVNIGKQIFFATCDENLYYLLQKKIPSDRFNAKYIEFETSGKVKS